MIMFMMTLMMMIMTMIMLIDRDRVLSGRFRIPFFMTSGFPPSSSPTTTSSPPPSPTTSSSSLQCAQEKRNPKIPSVCSYLTHFASLPLFTSGPPTISNNSFLARSASHIYLHFSSIHPMPPSSLDLILSPATRLRVSSSQNTRPRPCPPVLVSIHKLFIYLSPFIYFSYTCLHSYTMILLTYQSPRYITARHSYYPFLPFNNLIVCSHPSTPYFSSLSYSTHSFYISPPSHLHKFIKSSFANSKANRHHLYFQIHP